MKQVSIGSLAGEVYELLKGLGDDERRRVLSATMALFGDSQTRPQTPGFPAANSTLPPSQSTPHGATDAAVYFEQKQPKSKMEELAVAARFREITSDEETHSKEHIKAVFQLARRHFDSVNFSRDMDNAHRKNGLFLPSPSKGVHKLSYNGQKFVDALPDRASAKAQKKPKRARRKTQSAK